MRQREGIFEVRDAFELARTQVPRLQRGQFPEPSAQGVGLGHPVRQGFRAVEHEDAPGPGLGIALVAELGFDARGFVQERQRAVGIGLDVRRQVLRIMPRLFGHAGQQRAGLLGFDHADGLAVHQQKIIARAGFQRNFPQRDAPPGPGIELLVVLDHPAAGGQLSINLLPRLLFWIQFRHVACDGVFRLVRILVANA